MSPVVQSVSTTNSKMKVFPLLVCPIAILTTVSSLTTVDKDFEAEEIRVRMAAMEAGCYSQNRSYELLGKQGLTDEVTRWPGGVVPYSFGYGWSQDEIKIITEGMKLISDKTCIRFVPLDYKQLKNYVLIVNWESGCNAYVGMMKNEPKRIKSQTVNLNRNGCIHKVIAAHEFMHTLGIDHEQCRTDRDKYVAVHYENIVDGFKFAFDIEKNTSTYGLPYDFDSIMHYPQYAFSKNGKPVLSSKVPGREVTRNGNLEKLSEKDLQLIRKMYKCK